MRSNFSLGDSRPLKEAERKLLRAVGFLYDLLLVVLDDPGSTYFGLFRVIAKFSECPALAQEVPVLVKLDLQLSQATPVIVCQFAPRIQKFLFLHQAINMMEYRLIFILPWKFLSEDDLRCPRRQRTGPAASEPKDKGRCTHPIVKAEKLSAFEIRSRGRGPSRVLGHELPLLEGVHPTTAVGVETTPPYQSDD
jgi:hypothetical protein